MNSTQKSLSSIKHGAAFPFDAPDSWWGLPHNTTELPPQPSDWAHSAARGIIADLKDRRGIKNELHDIGEEIRVDIVQSIAAIIREASRPDRAADSVGDGTPQGATPLSEKKPSPSPLQTQGRWTVEEVPGGHYLCFGGRRILHTIHNNSLGQFQEIAYLANASLKDDKKGSSHLAWLRDGQGNWHWTVRCVARLEDGSIEILNGDAFDKAIDFAMSPVPAASEVEEEKENLE